MSTNELIEFFSAYVSEERYTKMKEVLRHRTRFITIVLEDIYQPHNASAVLRTCDATGVQDVHIIENRNSYTLNPDVVLGSEKWLSLYRYNSTEFNTPEALNKLKGRGYQLIATTPDGDQLLEDYHPKGPVAVMMGTELHGLSEEAMNMADVRLRIPMYGFTQSFNISVSAALILHQLTQRSRSKIPGYFLNPEEQDEVLLEWLKRSVKKSEMLERAYRKRRNGH